MSTMPYEKPQGYDHPDMGALTSESHEKSLVFTKKPGQDQDQVLFSGAWHLCLTFQKGRQPLQHNGQLPLRKEGTEEN